jgi:hypothetical protein
MGRRFVAGAGQLLLAIVGFMLFCAWFFNVMHLFYKLIDSDIRPDLHSWLAFSGLGLFALAWLWAWFTSFSLLREAKRNERNGILFGPPPVLPRA